MFLQTTDTIRMCHRLCTMLKFVQYNTLTLHVYNLTFILTGGGEGGGVTNNKAAKWRPQFKSAFQHM